MQTRFTIVIDQDEPVEQTSAAQAAMWQGSVLPSLGGLIVALNADESVTGARVEGWNVDFGDGPIKG